jgi:cephalosporin-C deacetylase-like acetyl esterase
VTRIGLLCGFLGLLAQAQDPLTVRGDFLGTFESSLYHQAQSHWTQRRLVVGGLSTPGAVRRRGDAFREWLVNSMGGWPEKTPLKARITGTLNRDGYRIEKLVYESRPNFRVTANLYIPNGRGPFPAILGTVGHSETSKADPSYQHFWVSMARRGVMVLTYDPPAQGERLVSPSSTPNAVAAGWGTAEHTAEGSQCLLTGTAFAAYEIWDGIRAVDYLLTRKDVDGRKLGVAGHSGGGTQAAFLMALDQRLSVGVVNCYMTTWERMWKNPGPQDAEQNFPGFLAAGWDYGDLLIASAPRPVLVSAAVRDFFPILGARAVAEEQRRIYRVAGRPDAAGYFEVNDAHSWSQPQRETAYRWFERFFGLPATSGAEKAVTPEPPNVLAVTPTGQLGDSFGSETVRSLNRRRAEEESSRRRALRIHLAEDLRATIAQRVGLNPPQRTPLLRSVATVQGKDWHGEKVIFESEPGVDLPGLLLLPGRGNPHGVTILVHELGKKAALAQGLNLIRSGRAALCLDVRGTGQLSPSQMTKGGATADYQLAWRVLMLGRTMVGMQALDMIQAVAAVKRHPGLENLPVELHAVGRTGVAAMLAGALSPRFASVQVEGSIGSWLEFAMAQRHADLFSLVVPGVLQDFDVPDLLRVYRPGVLSVMRPIHPDGSAAGR